MSERKLNLLCLDGSAHSERAFDCKFFVFFWFLSMQVENDQLYSEGLRKIKSV